MGISQQSGLHTRSIMLFIALAPTTKPTTKPTTTLPPTTTPKPATKAPTTSVTTPKTTTTKKVTDGEISIPSKKFTGNRNMLLYYTLCRRAEMAEHNIQCIF